jgi:hypothetical protein
LILLSAVIAGTIIGWGYARWNGWAWHPPIFRAVWVVVLGFLPQLAIFYLPSTRTFLTDEFAASSLIWSQVVLLVFALINIRLPGMPVLATGLALNLSVIIANGGLMPLPVETAERFADPSVLNDLVVGERIDRASKDILLPESQIILPWLSDRFVSPSYFSYRFAFSLGDVFVAAGAFWMLIVSRPVRPRNSGDSSNVHQTTNPSAPHN